MGRAGGEAGKGESGWREGCRQVGERNSIPREPKQINTGNRRKTKQNGQTGKEQETC